LEKEPSAARPIEPMALAAGLWAWLGLGLVLAVMAWVGGQPRVIGALALGLAAAPALAMFLMMPAWGRPWAAEAASIIWTAFAASAAAATGGAASPLAAAFLIGPALALRMGPADRLAEALAATAIGFGCAALTGAVFKAGDAPEDSAAVLIGGAGFACVMFAGWVLAAPSRDAPDKIPIETATAERSAAALHAAMMAHELRTPLTHILGFAEMMQAQVFGPLNSKYLEYAGLIRTSGANLLAMVNDLMELARIEAGRQPLEPADFDAVALCAEAIAHAQGAAAPKTIRLVSAFGAALPARADARALRHILTNLLGNAVKFTPAGGEVQISAVQEGQDLVIVVEDSGPGFPPSAFARLGAPFERGENVAETPGTGLGLALVRSLAEAQGGRLILANSDNGGALVTVRLPVMRA
jgi:nitrogen-specific signal transduction histidine kinase